MSLIPILSEHSYLYQLIKSLLLFAAMWIAGMTAMGCGLAMGDSVVWGSTGYLEEWNKGRAQAPGWRK